MTTVETATPGLVSRATGAEEASPPQSVNRLPDEAERRLIERAKAGDQAAFRELYERHAEAVYRYAILPIVRDRVMAEDLLAETFVRALENLGRFSWQGKGVLPWLVRIGKNLCLDHLRKNGRIQAGRTVERAGQDAPEWDGESMVARVETNELLRARIEACLQTLNPRYRHVLQLRMVERRPRGDAARSLGISVGTLDVLLFRACRSFRKVYIERYGAGLDVDPEVNP